MTGTVTVTYDGHMWELFNTGGRITNVIAATGGPYEAALLADVASRVRGGRAVDVGAQIGNHTLFFAVACELDVSAFEPNPDNHQRLVDNLRLNRLDTVDVHHVALSDRPGRATPAPKGKLTVGSGPVEVATLDSYHLDDVTVVKVDVEGMEGKVLAGAADTLTRCRPVVYCEAWSSSDHDGIARVLEPLGYRRTATIGRPGWAPNERWER